MLLVGADPLHAMPILDLRLRKAVRHSGLRLVIASERPTALDGGAEETARYLPGEGADFLATLAEQLGPRRTPRTPGGEAEDVAGVVGDAERLAGELRPGKTLVIWGEDLGRGPGGEAALASLLRICEALECSADAGGAFSVPTGSNARGVREVGCLPGFGPGFATTDRGRDLERIKDGLRDGELDGVILVHADPIRELDGRARLGRGAAPRPHRGRDLELRRRVDQGGRRRPPGRGVRREGGHGHPPRRAPAAPAARPCPAPGWCARCGRCSRS